jgi:hypothetical protein
MLGLPPDVQAKTLGYYEQRFVDGMAAGRSEQDVARELDDPKKIAMTLRANSAHSSAPTRHVKTHRRPTGSSPKSAARPTCCAAGVGRRPGDLQPVHDRAGDGLLGAAVRAVCGALAFYLGGIAITASGLAGNGELVLDLPSRYVQIDDDDAARASCGSDRRHRHPRHEEGDPARCAGGPGRRRRAPSRACAAAPKASPAARCASPPTWTPTRAPPRPCSASAWCWAGSRCSCCRSW